MSSGGVDDVACAEPVTAPAPAVDQSAQHPHDPTQQSLPEILHELVKRPNGSRRWVAERLGVSTRTVGKWLADPTCESVSLTHRLQLARLAGLPKDLATLVAMLPSAATQIWDDWSR